MQTSQCYDGSTEDCQKMVHHYTCRKKERKGKCILKRQEHFFYDPAKDQLDSKRAVMIM